MPPTFAILEEEIAALFRVATQFYQLKIPIADYNEQGNPIYKDSGQRGPPNVLTSDVPTSIAGAPNGSVLPLILVQLTEVSDGSLNFADGESLATVEVNIVTFDSDPQRQGRADVLNLLASLRTTLLEYRIIAGFPLRAPLHGIPHIPMDWPLYFGTLTAHYALALPRQKTNIDLQPALPRIKGLTLTGEFEL